MRKLCDFGLLFDDRSAILAMAALCLTGSGAGRIDCRISHGGVREGGSRVIFRIAALAGFLFQSKGRAGGFGYGFPLREAMRKLCGFGLLFDDRSAILAMATLGLTGSGAGRIDCRVGHGGVRQGGYRVVFNAATPAASPLYSE